MTTLRNTAIAAMATLTIALAASSPAHALNSWQKAQIGLGAAALVAGAAAHAHGYSGYHGGYRGGSRYRRTARRCARRWGWHTNRFEDCMYNHGY